MLEKVKSPEVRFKGFNNDWKQCKLSELVELFGGNSFSSSDVASEGVRWLKIANVSTGEIKWNDESFLPRDFWDKYTNYHLTDGDYIMALTRPILNHELKIAQLKGTIALLNQRVAKLVFIEKPDFVYHLLRKRKIVDFIENAITGTDPPNLGTKIFEKIQVMVPNRNEQEKIGLFFNIIDDTIAFHQRKHLKLQNIKKAMLEKILPQNGNCVPEVRFAGFTDDWVQRKLGDIGSTFTGLSGKTKEDFGHGDAKFVTYMNVYSNPVSNLELVDSVEIDSKQHEVEYGDVFFTTSSETAAEVGMSSVWLGRSPNVYLNSFCFGYRPDKNIDTLYLAYALRTNNVRAQLMLLAQGISRYNISKTKTMDVLLDLPHIDEQTKIGMFFKTLDDTITLHQHKLKKLKNIKKAMLDKIFV